MLKALKLELECYETLLICSIKSTHTQTFLTNIEKKNKNGQNLNIIKILKKIASYQKAYTI